MKCYKKGRKRLGAALLCVVMMCSLVPVNVPAAVGSGGDEGGGNVCHAGHEDCTWVEAVEEHACEYIVDEDEVEIEVLNCKHRHDSSCYPAETATPYDASELDCSHQHNVECYTTEKASPSDAEGQTGSHVHDESCGYVKGVEGVRCNHECEICDELYGELPKSELKKKVQKSFADTGDFSVSIGSTDESNKVKAEFDEQKNILTISGESLKKGEYGSVTVGMKEGIETTDQCIVIKVPTRDSSDDKRERMAVCLDGIKIETNGSAPITVSGNGSVDMDLIADTENYLTISGSYSTHAALEIGPDADVKIGGSNFLESTGTLYATSKRGTAIGGNYQKDAGKIVIYAGTIYATSEEGTGIGSGYGGGVKGITIGNSILGCPQPPVVTVNAKETGIGAGSSASGKTTGPIVIQGEAIVDVTAEEAGIGAGFDSGTVDSITISNADVTVVANDYAGIGTGQQSKVGEIEIDNSTVNIQCSNADAGIGSGYRSENGAINIVDSRITISSDSLFGGVTGIGNGNSNGVTGLIAISNSTLDFSGLTLGIGGCLDQSGGITLTDCATTITGGRGIEGISKGASNHESIVISGGSLKVTEESGQYGNGISVGGSGGSIELKDRCKVDLKLEKGISVGENCSLNVYDCELLYDYTAEYHSSAITGSGNVCFHQGSVVNLTSGYEGIKLNGKSSSLVFGDGSQVNITNDETAIELSGGGRLDFQNGCRVRAHTIGGSTFEKAMNCRGTVRMDSEADVAFVVKGARSEVVAVTSGTFEGDTCLVSIKSEGDLAGKTIEIRDGNGSSLTPAVTYIQQDSYKGLALKLPGPGKYTYYVDGKLQEFRNSSYQTETVMDVAAGINKAIEIKGEGGVTNVPVTGIMLDPAEITVKPGQAFFTVANFVPNYATNRNVTVVSSNPEVAIFTETRNDAIWLKGIAPGTATITVTTADGGYTAACKVTVSGETDEYRLTIAGSYASTSGAGRYAAGTVVSIHAGTRSGYQFSGWKASPDGKVSFADPSAPDTTFVMPDTDLTVSATWIKETNGAATGNSSGGAGDNSAGGVQTWSQNTDGTWKCQNGGIPYQSEWAYIYNPYADAGKGQNPYGWFRFGADGRMLTGWYTDETGNTYYLWPYADNAQGTMVVGWQWIRGEDGRERCYYFNPNSDGTQGRLMTNRMIEDQYLVDDKGAWVNDGVAVTR